LEKTCIAPKKTAEMTAALTGVSRLISVVCRYPRHRASSGNPWSMNDTANTWRAPIATTWGGKRP
jgi:hypothetical protein